MKKIILLLMIGIIIPLVYATDDCPDYRINDGSRFMCTYGNYDSCANADENDPSCISPNYDCDDINPDDLGVNQGDGPFSCIRCNTEDGYRGRVPFCNIIEYEGEDEVDDFEGNLGEVMQGEGYTLLLAAEGVGEIIVLEYEDSRCCSDEGERPEGFEECCSAPANAEGPGNQMQLDWREVNSGICGCPYPYPEEGGWRYDRVDDSGRLGVCSLGRATCYPVVGTCPAGINPVDDFLQWLTTPGCFMDFFDRVPGDIPYERACCPFQIGGEYPEIWDFDLDDSLIEIY